MNALVFDAVKFDTGPSDPRLAQWLEELPPAVFSERLYQSIELMERYSIELAIDLSRQLKVVDRLSKWRSESARTKGRTALAELFRQRQFDVRCEQLGGWSSGR